MIRRSLLAHLTLLLALILAACGATPAVTESPTKSAVVAAVTAAGTTAPAETPGLATTSAPAATPISDVTATSAATEAVGLTATSAPDATTASPSALTATDTAGRTVSFERVPTRIVSIAPSNTEILFALGLGPQVLAVDDFSDYPEEARKLPKIGGVSGKLNFEQIVALKPDLVLAAGITPGEAIAKMEELKLPVVVVGATETSFDKIIDDIALVGKITRKQAEAERVTKGIRDQLQQVEAAVAKSPTKPRVFWELDATDVAKPFTVGPGGFVNEIIERAGGANIFASASSPYPQVSAEQVVAANPEVILLADAAYGMTVESVLARSGWSSIAAVQQKRVHPVDSNLVSRPGPRIGEGLMVVAKLIHPEAFK